MPNVNDLRGRIGGIRQTRKITNAMYLISTSRMRRALEGIERNKEYFYGALATMLDIRANAKTDHPYLVHRGGKRTAYIVIAGEKGLSGSYSHDVLSLADKSMEGRTVSHVFTVGNMAAAHFRRRGLFINENFAHIGEDPTINTSRRMVSVIMDLYDSGEIDELRLVYTRFVNTLTYHPTDMKMLPLELDALLAGRETPRKPREILYDPSPEEVFDAIVPQFIIGFLYGALVNSYASENCARMGAMDNATKNADEMLESLNRQYHAMRQLSITNEISEIVSGAEAMKQK